MMAPVFRISEYLRQGKTDEIETDQEGLLRILQLTDFHDDTGPADVARTRESITKLVAANDPHLLAVTGDIWCGDEEPERGEELMEGALDFLGSLKVPWAFTWGNHDYVGDFDEAALAYRWAHPDPAVDRIQQSVMATVEQARREGHSRREVFGSVWEAAGGEGEPPITEPQPTVTVPYLTEPWYC